MTFLRKLLLFIAVPVGLLTALVVLACLPAVQTWAARRVLASQPGMEAELGGLAVGWSTVRVTDLRVVQPGLRLTLPSAEIDLPLLAAARGRVDLRRLVAEGWTVELSEPAEGAVKPTTKPAGGGFDVQADLLDRLTLPFDLSLGEVVLSGVVTLPEGSAEVRVNRVAPPAGGAGATLDQVIALNAAFTPAADAGLPVSGLLVEGEVQLRQVSARRLDRVAAAVTLHALGDQFAGGRASMNALVSLERAATDGVAARLSLQAAERQLVSLALDLTAAGAATGTWAVEVRDADVAPFALGRPLPEFALTGAGGFSSDLQGLQPAVAGELRLELRKLARMDPALAGVGPLTLDSAFDLAGAGTKVRVRRLALTVSREQQPFLVAESLQALVVDPATGGVEAAVPGNDLARVALTELPLAWLKPWLGEDLQVSGGPVSGEWRVSAENDNLKVRPVTALTVAGVSVEQAGRPLLRAVDLSLGAGASRTGGVWSGELLDLSARSAGRLVFKLSGQGGVDAAKGVFEADLPALLAQPVAAGSADVVIGRIRGDFAVSLAAAMRLDAKMELDGLRATGAEALPAVTLKVSAERDAQGVIGIEAPLLVTVDDRSSDLLVKAVLTPVGEVLRVKGAVTGKVIHLPDVQALAALAPAESAEPVGGQAPDKEEREKGPFWAGLEGTLSLSIKRVVYAPGVELADIEGEVMVDGQAISIVKLGARLGADGVLAASGGLRHEAKRKQPYAVAGDVLLTGFDPGPFLRAANPGRAPVLEGSFDLKGTLSGRALEPTELVSAGRGRVDLTSRGGTLRALGVKVESAANLAGPAAAVLGLFGAATGNESATKYAERARASGEVARMLSEVKFDRMDMSLLRDQAGDLVIEDLLLQAPMVRLSGGGRVKYREGVSLVNQALNVQLNLAARDRLARGLSSLRLLGAEADAGGFFPLSESIQLDGSLAAVGTSQLERLLRRALTQ